MICKDASLIDHRGFELWEMSSAGSEDDTEQQQASIDEDVAWLEQQLGKDEGKAREWEDRLSSLEAMTKVAAENSWNAAKAMELACSCGLKHLLVPVNIGLGFPVEGSAELQADRHLEQSISTVDDGETAGDHYEDGSIEQHGSGSKCRWQRRIRKSRMTC
jgi:hypothetical protein